MDGPEGHIPPDPRDVDAVCDLLRRDRRQLGDRLRVMHPSDIADLLSAIAPPATADRSA